MDKKQRAFVEQWMKDSKHQHVSLTDAYSEALLAWKRQNEIVAFLDAKDAEGG